MPFWIGLVFRGARTGGLQEARAIMAEAGQLNFPDDYPDTPAGHQWEQSIRTEKEAKYSRVPPAKRSNFVKLGVVAPYHCPWLQLVQDWKKTQNQHNIPHHLVDHHSNNNTIGDEVLSVQVLRDKQVLQDLGRCCVAASKYSKPVVKIVKVSKCQTVKSVKHHPAEVAREELYEKLCKCCVSLVGVRVSMLHRGTPGPFSMICVATPQDLLTLSTDHTYNGPCEPPHKDQHHIDKKNKKKSKQSKKSKKSDNKATEVNVFHEVKTVQGVCSREVLGYLNHGSFALTEGKGSGKGFVAICGLVKVLREKKEDKQVIVLVRDTASLQYRFAYLSIIT